ncbi:MAG: hypothetical protein WC593_15200 [Methanoregula sp.]
MAKKRFLTCPECGITYWTFQCASHTPKTCGAKECLNVSRKRDIAKVKKHSTAPKEVNSVCEVCGKAFKGRIKGRKYACCGDPACRMEVRRRRGREATQKAKENKAAAKMNHCLGHGCDAMVNPPRHFCDKCRELQRRYSVRCLGTGEAI